MSTGQGKERRRWTREQKLEIVAQSQKPGMAVSHVARQHGIAPGLLFRWRKELAENGRQVAAAENGGTKTKCLADRVRELERLLGRATLEIEILREKLAERERGES